VVELSIEWVVTLITGVTIGSTIGSYIGYRVFEKMAIRRGGKLTDHFVDWLTSKHNKKKIIKWVKSVVKEAFK